MQSLLDEFHRFGRRGMSPYPENRPSFDFEGPGLLVVALYVAGDFG